jgi:hypothetical protein
MALSLRERLDLGPQQFYRLVGVGLSHFQIDLVEQEEQRETGGDASFLLPEAGE